MMTKSARLSEVGLWIVVACAVLTTGLVLRREFVEATPLVEGTARPEAVYVKEWDRALAIGIRSGATGAPVQVVEFADFQCPFCASFEATVRTIREKYPDEVALTFVHLPLPMHRFAESAARAAECAHVQGRFEQVRSLLFEKRQTLGSTPWREFAIEGGVPDIEQFDGCMADTTSLERVQQGKSLAGTMGVRGTPTVIVNGWMIPVVPSVEDFDKIVRNVLDGKPAVADMPWSGGS